MLKSEVRERVVAQLTALERTTRRALRFRRRIADFRGEDLGRNTGSSRTANAIVPMLAEPLRILTLRSSGHAKISTAITRVLRACRSTPLVGRHDKGSYG